MDANTRAKAYDAVVIGGGHNGLVAAAYLAKAGHKVVVMERRGALGGAAATEPVFPGWKVNTGAVDAALFRPEVVAELELDKHGLSFLSTPVQVCALQPGGSALTLWNDVARSQEEIARLSPRDARNYPDFVQDVQQMAGALQPVLGLVPPDLPHLPLGELLPWLRAALDVRRMGGEELMGLLRALPMAVEDFLDERFESPLLKAALGARAVKGSLLGPKASGTAFLLLYQALGASGPFASRLVQGGTGSLAEALASAARRFGAEICTGMGVSRLELHEGGVAGVVLDNGQSIAAKAVVSSIDPFHTFFDLVGAAELEVRLVRELKAVRFQAGISRVNLALRGLPHFTGLPEGNHMPLTGRVQICPDLEYLERAGDDAKYGAISSQPFLEWMIPTLSDPSLAPDGWHLMCVDIHYTPYTLAENDWPDQREALSSRVVGMLGEYAPDLPGMVAYSQTLTPLDYESQYGLHHGDIYHGQMGLDQLLFMRPVPGLAQYRTPIQGLYLCGSGSHPGGGVTGAPGRNAARQILKELRPKR